MTHVVESDMLHTAPHVLVLSARTEEALARSRQRLADRLAESPEHLADVAATLHRGREVFPVRCAVVAGTVQEAVRLLRSAPGAGDVEPSVHRGHAPHDPPVVVEFAVAGWEDHGPHHGLAEVRAELDAGPADLGGAVRRGVLGFLRSLGIAPCAVRGVDEATDRTFPAADAAPPLRVHIAPGPVRTADAFSFDASRPGAYADLVAHLWTSGLDVDVTLRRPGRRLRLPVYAFERVTADSGSAGVSSSGRTRPLTPLEQRRLFHDLVRSGEGTEYNRTAVGAVKGRLDRDAVQTAFAALQQCHPQLRTVLEEEGGRWRARVLESPTVRVALLDVAETVEGPVPEEWLGTIARRPFRHAGEPYVRCGAVVTQDETQIAVTVYEPMALEVPVDRLHAELVSLLKRPTTVKASASVGELEGN